MWIPLNFCRLYSQTYRHTILGPVLEMIHFFFDWLGYCWSQLTAAISNYEWGQYKQFVLVPSSCQNWSQFISYYIPSTVAHLSYGDISFAPNYRSFKPRVRQVLVQVSLCVVMPVTTVVIASKGFQFLLWVYTVFCGGWWDLDVSDIDQ